MEIVFVLLAVVGASLASFLDVLADRLPREERPFGRSSCLACRRQLTWFELIPVVSWFVLRGRCRSCGAVIPLRHLVGEIGLAAFFVFAFATLPEPSLTGEPHSMWLLAFRLLLLSALTVVVIADFRFFVIPDLVSVGLFVFLAAALAFGAVMHAPWESVMPPWQMAVLGALFGAGFLGAFSWISRGTWMGWGDVKLAGALGLAFGFPSILLLLAFAFVSGAAAGLFLLALRLKTMRDFLPFGPFIAIAALPFLFGFHESIERFFGLSDFFVF